MTHPAVAQLPADLTDLHTLAQNLRWSWDAPTRSLFHRIDPALWRATGHNPVRLLAQADGARLAALADDTDFTAAVRERAGALADYLAERDTWYARHHGHPQRRLVAYFSAEFGITECLRIFSGGLGVLAGDHLKSASDLGVPLCGVGLFYGLGYFTQHVDADGRQQDVYSSADPQQLPLRPVLDAGGVPLLVSFPMPERQAYARIWRADVGRVPLYLLDTNVPENVPEDRHITDRLYGGDVEHRLKQEVVLGIGGMRALRLLGEEPLVVHLNEGHAAFAALERARPHVEGGLAFRDACAEASRGIVFTTHTPVAAGHDYFPAALLERYLGSYVWELREPWDRFLALGGTRHDARFCMTALAIRTSGIRNGVSRLHGVVSRTMWHDLWPELSERDVPIGHITNGVHLPSWVGEDVARLYEDRIGADWHADAGEMHWHRAAHIPLDELWRARRSQRAALVAAVRRCLAAEAHRRGEDAGWTSTALDPDALTIVFARRFATYKRATLLLSQPERLMALLRDRERPVQFVFAGKAHPRDTPGQALLQQVARFARMPEFRDRFIFLENYDVELARHLVQGADVWLNVPLRPYEASGTSGMKSAANGGLNLSIPDGWWAEAWEEHNRLPEPIGWNVSAGASEGVDLDGPEAGREEQDRADAEALYSLLEREVVPLFHDQRRGADTGWAERMRSAIRQGAGYFNTHRMVRDYVESAYHPAAAGARPQDDTADLASGA